eukprot:CAMPEP_0178939956 /NCGR_PEP_ID=MMETSP0789-20121207/517_1 /TAXON_ID=3005 /ORGANISM="Rhizosolenia setigera, Strain CCMP 1694" /LENGTH=35 /DNA_ID= /DNA_START= /DNA_END= /DNA_ORIENTATION=
MSVGKNVDQKEKEMALEMVDQLEKEMEKMIDALLE